MKEGRKISNKCFKKIISYCTILALVLSLMPFTIFAADTNVSNQQFSQTNAVLYVDTDGNLGYNVVHTADTNSTTVVDLTGNNITAMEILKKKAVEYAVLANLNVDENGVMTNLYVTAVITRPKVGISWKSDTIGSDYKNFQTAFNRNGADAFFLPKFTSEKEANDYLVNNSVNGVFETGGSDVNPYYYGELQTPHGSGMPDNVRDVSDIALIQAAITLNVPLLGVCRGEQIFNVAMGGGLIQDIPYYLGQKVLKGEVDVSRVTTVLSGKLPGSDTVVKDTGYTLRDFSLLGLGAMIAPTYDKATQTYVADSGCDGDGHLRVWIDGVIHSGSPSYHELGNKDVNAIDKTSKWLYNIAGSSSLSLVATAHHQSVNPDKLGKGLTIVAHSSDGIVEGIEYQDNLFALGIQFHPERDALGNSQTAIDNNKNPDIDKCNDFLRALVKYAAIHNGYTGNYSVSTANTSNGSISADVTMPLAGSTVTLTASPSVGYELASINVTDESGNNISVTSTNGVFTFIMPTSAVTISSKFNSINDAAVTNTTTITGTTAITDTTAITGAIAPATGDSAPITLYVLMLALGSISIIAVASATKIRKTYKTIN